MTKPQNPHDKGFKSLMRQITFAKAFIEQHVTPATLELLDLSTLELWNANFVYQKNHHDNEPENSESFSDVVYKVKTVDKRDCYIALLFEHQSRPEKLMSFRLLEYEVLLMRQHLNQGGKQLPLILPIVFYHGQTSPYPYSTDIMDCFESPELAKAHFLKPFTLIDVTVIPDEELRKNIITAPLQIIMKHIRDNDLLPIIRELAETGVLAANAQQNDGQLLKDAILYVMSAGEISNRAEFDTLLLNQPDEVRRNFMTILEQHQQEMQQERQQGIQQGVQQEKHHIVHNMLMKHMPVNTIAELTGLTEDEVNQLKAEMTH